MGDMIPVSHFAGFPRAGFGCCDPDNQVNSVECHRIGAGLTWVGGAPMLDYPRSHHMLSLKDKIVFITGASAGIGEATARAFAAQGARILLCARRSERIEKLAQALEKEYKVARSHFQPRRPGPGRRRQGHRRAPGRVAGDRGPGQQRRPEPGPGQAARRAPQRLGGDDRHQRQGPPLRHPGRPARHDRARPRPHHQHRLPRRATRSIPRATSTAPPSSPSGP